MSDWEVKVDRDGAVEANMDKIKNMVRPGNVSTIQGCNHPVTSLIYTCVDCLAQSEARIRAEESKQVRARYVEILEHSLKVHAERIRADERRIVLQEIEDAKNKDSK